MAQFFWSGVYAKGTCARVGLGEKNRTRTDWGNAFDILPLTPPTTLSGSDNVMDQVDGFMDIAGSAVGQRPMTIADLHSRLLRIDSSMAAVVDDDDNDDDQPTDDGPTDRRRPYTEMDVDNSIMFIDVLPKRCEMTGTDVMQTTVTGVRAMLDARAKASPGDLAASDLARLELACSIASMAAALADGDAHLARRRTLTRPATGDAP